MELEREAGVAMVGLASDSWGVFLLVWLFNDFNHVSSDNSAALSGTHYVV